ncbi:uncharacterized protein C8Q71DRAFT_907681 [Rhodofomes roseus]|uniref:Uncharacterized protein n=1 Tax=Rhodofomes roseus TaxID=34475 RepID=A0ABQ8KGW6_9APHY|nr:uncharacterized protein C8Q71DRAFT_907681 [Rhodofomes roseus]KAH9836842.1 hypothetical protein C8Q71DRAFT_907681 [Rhodofomes roseus]
MPRNHGFGSKPRSKAQKAIFQQIQPLGTQLAAAGYHSREHHRTSLRTHSHSKGCNGACLVAAQPPYFADRESPVPSSSGAVVPTKLGLEAAFEELRRKIWNLGRQIERARKGRDKLQAKVVQLKAALKLGRVTRAEELKRKAREEEADRERKKAKHDEYHTKVDSIDVQLMPGYWESADNAKSITLDRIRLQLAWLRARKVHVPAGLSSAKKADALKGLIDILSGLPPETARELNLI